MENEKYFATVAEYTILKNLITNVYPSGIISVVCDSFDLWTVLEIIVPKLKKDILNRDGKLVIRPDSGDPVEMVAGIDMDNVQICEDAMNETVCMDYCYCEKTKKYYRKLWKTSGIEEITEAERKGVVELLWEIFGGTETELGYKVLDSHIGTIYGDAITLERCKEICRRLKNKGFASTNVVYGIGSYTYNCNTRDQFGFALKSTYCVVDNKEKQIFKNPITDKDNFKKSQKGKVVVLKTETDKDGNYTLYCQDELNAEQFNNEQNNQMVIAFENGKVNESYLTSLSEIREKINKEI